MKKLFTLTLFVITISITSTSAQQQFELVNNFIYSISFISGNDEGIEQNLEDNLQWMQNQGYTHLRFFGIFPNGFYTFPSPTLDANGYSTNPYLEGLLKVLVTKADLYNITINFDGWEIIAESNQDTTKLGVGFITEEEIADVVQEVLSLGVNLISEEQFGKSYLQAIQSVTSKVEAIHETTADYWWKDTTLADEQLSSVFSFYHYNQAEVDYLQSLGTYPPSNLGNFHISAEGARYFGYPFSVAVGSFGNLEAENWKNILLFAQIQHLPQRFSIEETNTSFTIWNSNFNFMNHVGNELLSYAEQSFDERPIANLVLNASAAQSFQPALFAGEVNKPAIVNTLTLLGYRVVTTVDSIIPEAEIYYLLTIGGGDSSDIVPLPDYILPLLNSSSTLFLHPVLGIPDENDANDWVPVREFFGLPAGETQTLLNSVPETTSFEGFPFKWGGVNLYITPRIENLLSSQIDSSIAEVILSEKVLQEDVALIISNGNKYLINSNVIHLEASFVLSSLLNGPLNTPSISNIAITKEKVLIFAEYNTDIDIDLPWKGNTQVIRYDPLGNKIQDEIIDLDSNYSETLLRGEFVLLLDVALLSVSNKLSNSISLFQNYPNPFNSTTTIRYNLLEPSEVELKIYNILGQEVRTLVNEKQSAGEKKVIWDTRNNLGQMVSSGIYIGSLKADKNRESLKIVVLQ